MKSVLLMSLNPTVDKLISLFDKIPSDRKKKLKILSHFIQGKINTREPVYLNFICTHNSRRSHICQIWAQMAAYYYDLPGVKCYSGGTEATAFNPRAVDAMQKVGFRIELLKDGGNPLYEVFFSNDAGPVVSFSKRYDDPFNNVPDFAAIMTCSHADKNCPLVLGASARIAITYDDPKNFDGTTQESVKYKESVYQIGTEMLWAFSMVTNKT